MLQIPITQNIMAELNMSGSWFLRDLDSNKVSTHAWTTPELAEEAFGADAVVWDDEAEDELLIAKCVGCGCDDLHACISDDQLPCHWLRLDRTLGLGVCSECPGDLTEWDASEHHFKLQNDKHM